LLCTRYFIQTKPLICYINTLLDMIADKKIVNQKDVSCDGGNGPLGHPKVYLQIKHDKSEITCPYCGKEFVYVENRHSEESV
jgi:uncharacterized Zn-finger protein